MSTADIPILGSPPAYFRCTQVGTDANGNPVYVLGTTDGTSPGLIGTATDKGGTITVGGTAQNAAAANTSRKSAIIENPTTETEALYVALAGAATVAGAGNYADLAPGGSAIIYGTGAISVNAATTGHRFICTEW